MSETESMFEGMDDDFKKELIQTFILEFEELLDVYVKALQDLRSFKKDKEQALHDIFRVFHTLKGDAGYFDEFKEFVAFSSNFCERLRNPNLDMLKNETLMHDISLNYARLSSAFYALNKGKSLRAFRFKLFLSNF